VDILPKILSTKVSINRLHSAQKSFNVVFQRLIHSLLDQIFSRVQEGKKFGGALGEMVY